MDILARLDFRSALFFFAVRRLRLLAKVGLVAKRLLGVTKDFLIISFKRFRTISRLRTWCLVSSHLSTIAPSFVHLAPAIFFSLFFTGSDKEGDLSASNRNSTALLVLFTFCPPGPEALINCSLNSPLFMVILSSIFSIFGIYHFYLFDNLVEKAAQVERPSKIFGGGPVRWLTN